LSEITQDQFAVVVRILIPKNIGANISVLLLYSLDNCDYESWFKPPLVKGLELAKPFLLVCENFEYGQLITKSLKAYFEFAKGRVQLMVGRGRVVKLARACVTYYDSYFDWIKCEQLYKIILT